jgi:hypothetical protein
VGRPRQSDRPLQASSRSGRYPSRGVAERTEDLPGRRWNYRAPGHSHCFWRRERLAAPEIPSVLRPWRTSDEKECVAPKWGLLVKDASFGCLILPRGRHPRESKSTATRECDTSSDSLHTQKVRRFFQDFGKLPRSRRPNIGKLLGKLIWQKPPAVKSKPSRLWAVGHPSGVESLTNCKGEEHKSLSQNGLIPHTVR